jgi:UDP-glucose 4-epimerase
VRNQAVIVTGGAGFIGSHLVEAVLAEGRRPIVLDDLSTGQPDNVDPAADLETIDITDSAALDRVVSSARPAAIFHLAAQSSVTASVSDPVRDCSVNVHGTLNVVESAKRCTAPVVYTSTGGALYGNDAPRPTAEDFQPEPLAPYGASKWAGEAYVSTWARSDKLAHAVCRLGNVYGPRQSPHGEAGVVAIFSHQLWRNEPPTVYGFGEPTRDYVHVHDIVRALLAAEGKFGIFNVSTGVETDAMTIFRQLRAAAGSTIEPVLAPLRPGELAASCLDPRWARRELGWQAEIELEEGLTTTHEALVSEFERAALGLSAGR